MSEITQPPPDVQTQDQNTRVNRLSAASDHSASNKQSAEQQPGGNPAAETEPEKQVSHHDPAVTLASTLAKLDSGSHFQASVSGQDADGRTIVASELGTYLTEVDREVASKSQVEEFQKLNREESFDVRVVTVDKEIKAEILKNTETETGATKTVTIPVSLTLTELGHHPPAGQEQPPTPTTTQTPIDDIRSQYQATTLYKAERIAREIGDKLDNLPLPTSAPNYTVYGSSEAPSEKQPAHIPQQVSTNVFIQEVSSATRGAAQSETLNANLNQILGSNINIEVIKTVQPTAVPLPAGLPEAVIKELSAKSPLDQVQKGQNLTIKIAAIAIPEDGKSGALPTAAATSSTPTAAPANPSVPNQTVSAPVDQAQSQSASVNVSSDVSTSQTSPGIHQNNIVSGIIIDPAQTSISQSASPQKAETEQQPAHNPVSQTPYGRKNTAQTFTNISDNVNTGSGTKTYYLATPTSVLKFQSPIPLVPGTIVNFSVADGQTTAASPNVAAQGTTQTGAEENQSVSGAPQATTGTITEAITGAIPTALSDKIDQLPPQPLDQLPEDWASISLALSALTSSATSGAATMASRIPNLMTPEQITSTIFFFLSAIKSTTPAKTWFGSDVSDKLRKIGAGRILNKVDHDFTRIARLSADVPAGEWRPTLIPFQSGSPDITAIPMIIKQIAEDEKNQSNKQGQSDEDGKAKTTRFILEINFSQFGRILVDGFLKATRLDIILKSEQSIPPSMKNQLSEKYVSSLESSGFSGELVIIDNTEPGISVTDMIKTMAHQSNFEEKI